jgi:hypothetical protein
MSWLKSEATVAINLVAVYKALGGGPQKNAWCSSDRAAIFAPALGRNDNNERTL